ncbi:MAG TPA: hypothetical protein PKK10_04530 [Woeseiaceae bacterium]|nr:hypothetical protein [Woeseiaceae bacterium]
MKTNIYQGIISLFVGSVLLLQAIISIAPVFGGTSGSRYWPILGYAMYSRSYSEGDFVDIYRLLEGVAEDGTIIPIPKESLGLHLWHYRNLVRDLQQGRKGAFEHLFSKLPPGTDIVEIRVKSFPVAVTRDGPVEKDSVVLATFPVPNRFRVHQ